MSIESLSLSQSALALLPELVLVGGWVVLLLLNWTLGHQKLSFWLLGLLLGAYGLMGALALSTQPQHLFGGSANVDYLTGVTRIAAAGMAVAGWAFSYRHPVLWRPGAKTFEWLLLLPALVLGAVMLTASQHGMLAFTALELLSICGYILTGYNRSGPSAEAALKYLIFGAVSAALFVYGLSWYYGFGGSLFYGPQAAIQLPESLGLSQLGAALGLLLAGVLFKLAAVPFHVWAPDAYQSAPAPAAAVLSVLPKLGAVGFFIRFAVPLQLHEGIGEWTGLVVGVLALLSMTLGNLAALFQQNFRRLLAYSGVAHMGFLLIGAAVGGSLGWAGAWFYLVAYAIFNLAAFSWAGWAERQTGSPHFADWGRSGLGVWPRILLGLLLVGLAGLPPTVGFIGKLGVFIPAWEAYSASEDTLWLVLLLGGGLNTVLGLAYYLRVALAVFPKQAERINGERLKKSAQRLPLTTILAGLGVLLGLIAFDHLLSALESYILPVLFPEG